MRPIKASVSIFLAAAFALALLSPSSAFAGWAAKASMNQTRDRFAYGSYNGKFYVYAGFDGTNLRNTLEVYDPAANAWTISTPQAQGVMDITTALVSGRFIIVGGHFDNYVIDHFEKSLDPATGLLGDETPRNPVTAQASSVAYTLPNFGPEIYVFGGALSGNQLSNKVQAYNPATKTWRDVTTIPAASLTGSPAIGIVGSTVYLMGGQRDTGPASDIISYDILKDQWTTSGLGALQKPRRFTTGGSVPLVRGRFYLPGGNESMAAFPTNAIEVYDPRIGLCWPLADSLPEGLAGQGVFVAGSDAQGYTLYVAGGIMLDTSITNKMWALPIDNGQGILPSQQAPDDTDLNANGVPDNLEPERIKVVKTYVGNALFGVELTGAPVGSAIESVTAMPATVAANVPRDFPAGLVAFRIAVPHPGDQAIVTIRLNYDAPADTLWYKWSKSKGWYDFSSNVTWVDRRTVRVLLVDGGDGDSDGAADGYIYDPIGPSSPFPAAVTKTTIILPGGESCFISSLKG